MLRIEPPASQRPFRLWPLFRQSCAFPSISPKMEPHSWWAISPEPKRFAAMSAILKTPVPDSRSGRGRPLSSETLTFSPNLPSSYSVNVYSANGGSLRDASSDAMAAIPYLLCLGGATSSARGGVFSFAASGKYSKYSEPLKVALTIPSVPQTSAGGFYTDQLMFSISAN